MAININILVTEHIARLTADNATFIPDEGTLYTYLTDYFAEYGTFSNITYQNDKLAFGYKNIADQTKLYSLNEKFDILVNLADVEEITTVVKDITVVGNDIIITYSDDSTETIPIPSPDLTPYAELAGATFTGKVIAPEMQITPVSGEGTLKVDALGNFIVVADPSPVDPSDIENIDPYTEVGNTYTVTDATKDYVNLVSSGVGGIVVLPTTGITDEKNIQFTMIEGYEDVTIDGVLYEAGDIISSTYLSGVWQSSILSPVDIPDYSDITVKVSPTDSEDVDGYMNLTNGRWKLDTYTGTLDGSTLANSGDLIFIRNVVEGQEYTGVYKVVWASTSLGKLRADPIALGPDLHTIRVSKGVTNTGMWQSEYDGDTSSTIIYERLSDKLEEADLIANTDLVHTTGDESIAGDKTFTGHTTLGETQVEEWLGVTSDIYVDGDTYAFGEFYASNNVEVEGDINLTSGGDFNLTGGGDIELAGASSINLQYGDITTLGSISGYGLNITAGESVFDTSIIRLQGAGTGIIIENGGSISLDTGDITAGGTITASNLSGTNTGDDAPNANTDLVHISGVETITGAKTFTDSISVNTINNTSGIPIIETNVSNGNLTLSSNGVDVFKAYQGDESRELSITLPSASATALLYASLSDDLLQNKMLFQDPGGKFILYKKPDGTIIHYGYNEKKMIESAGSNNTIYAPNGTDEAIVVTNSDINLKQETKIGDDTNYTQFDTNGHQTMVGTATVWLDVLGDVTKLKVQGAGINEVPAEAAVEFLTSSNLSDYIYTNFQLNHNRKLGADVHPHIHWWQTENATPNWLIQYRWVLNGQAKVTAWTDYPLTTNAYTYVSGTLNQITYNGGITPPAGDNVSTILQVRILRDNSNASGEFAGADTYSTAASITSVDIHIEVDSIGSNEEYVK